MDLSDLTPNGALRHSAIASFWGRGGALPAFVAAAAVLLMLVWALAAGITGQGVLPVVAPMVLFLVMVVVAGRGLWRHYPHARLGACNLVTLFRAGLISMLVTPLLLPDIMGPGNPVAWGVLGIAAMAFALDGVDGWLARWSGLQSAFGARFDMEVDAVFAALLSLIALITGQAGWWVLGLGFMRYAFVVAGWRLPWLRSDLPDRFRRKVVCVVQIGTLIMLLAPVVQPPVSVAMAVLALAVLVWSFALDVLWLWRAREGSE